MKKILLLLFGTTLALSTASSVAALNPLDRACTTQPDTAVCQENAANKSGDPIAGSGGIIATIFTWLVRITGVVSIIMIVVGGFKYVISGGDSAGVQSAKNTIIYAVVGLVVSGVAGLLVRFVVGRLG